MLAPRLLPDRQIARNVVLILFYAVPSLLSDRQLERPIGPVQLDFKVWTATLDICSQGSQNQCDKKKIAKCL